MHRNLNTANAVALVDDDEELLTVVSKCLATCDYRVTTYLLPSQLLEDVSSGQAFDCIILDFSMPECDGISLLKKIRMAGVSTPVIIMTGYGDVKTAVDSIKSGAVDFVEKPINADLLASCVKRAIEDYTEIKNESEKRNQALELLDSLTLRQVQILNLVCSGCSSKEIARELKISYRTVEVHRAAIMLRLRITSVAELVQIKLMADQASSHSSRLLSNK